MTWGEITVLAGSALAAGAVNAVAGGGTLLTFPALLLAGTAPVAANATSTVALTLGTAGSLFGFRKQWAETRRWLTAFVPVSIAGGLAGSWLVTRLGDRSFLNVVPWLLLFATVLFLTQSRIKALLLRRKGGGGEVAADGALSMPACVALQFFVALYGGYFGAGIGILMLAVLGFMGMADIHRMNALKNVLAAVINGTAALWFSGSGAVDWTRAAVMLPGALAGYWLGAHFSQRIPQKAVRAFVVGVGLAISAVMFWRLFGTGQT